MYYLSLFRAALTFLVFALWISPRGELTAAPQWINDGSESPPRLEVEQAIWAMGGLPRGAPAWNREQQVARIAGAPFDGFMVFLPSAESDQDEYRALAQKHNLALTLQCAPSSGEDLHVALSAAKRMDARALVAMIRPTFVTYDEGAAKIRAMMVLAREAKMPFYVETHRGSITQDLLLTGEWARTIDSIQFHADLSHFVVSYSVGGVARGRIAEVFDAVLARTGMLDGRVGNGQQVQIDVGPSGDNEHAARFARWWKTAMVSWLRGAGPGDVFVFKSELGPPPYSIVNESGEELSDRWAQALVLRDLGIRTWNAAVKEAGRGVPYASSAAARVAAARPVAPAPAVVSDAKKPATKKSAKPGVWPQALMPVKSEVGVLRGVSHRLGDFHLTGQPAQPDLEDAWGLGIKSVINVRMKRELGGLGFDEDVAAESIGFKYFHIPVAPANLDDARMKLFLETLRQAPKPVLIHGSNGNRVWGLWSLYMGDEHGVSVDETAKVARKIGVKKLVVDGQVKAFLKTRGVE